MTTLLEFKTALLELGKDYDDCEIYVDLDILSSFHEIAALEVATVEGETQNYILIKDYTKTHSELCEDAECMENNVND